MLRKRFAGALLLSTLIAVPAWSAEAPRLLGDINKKPLSPDFGDYPALASNFFPLDGRLFFSTAVSAFREGEGILWSTDGTPEGTTVVSSTLCPSPCSGITPVASLGDAVVLRVGPFYWRTDGTPAGTFQLPGRIPSSRVGEELVTDPSTGSESLYFLGDGPEGVELWRTDGTRAGTRIIKDLYPGSDGSYPRILTAWAGRLCFLADGEDESGSLQSGLWCTDGTAEGTRFLSAVHEDYNDPARVVPLPSHLLFTTGTFGEDLWGTDGTREGTRLLQDFPLPPCTDHHRVCGDDTPDVNSLVAVGDAAYLHVDGELWTSDGTPEGTHPVPGFRAGASPDLTTLQRLGGRWFFVSFSRIWTAGDGFSGAAPLTGCEGGACPDVLQILPDTDPGRRLFIGKDPAHGIELWITDGTGAGTKRLADACPGACDGLYFDGYTPVVLGSSQGRSWFIAYPNSESSSELWTTDGTPAGTRRIAGHTASVGILDGRAYFGLWGTDAYSSEVWTADGSRSGTRRVTTLKRIAPSSDPVFVPLDHGAALFDATQGERRQLWASDGTPEGTGLITGFREVLYGELTRVGSLYFFSIYKDDSDGNFVRDEIWRTDGTRSGTRRMAAFDSNQEIGADVARVWNGQYLFPVTYFSSVDDLNDCSYWISDGTPAGTREIVPPLSGVRLSTGLHPFGSRFLFVSRKEAKGGPVPQIFVSDGTPAGTLQLTNNRGTREPLETEFVQLGRTAFFRIYGLDGKPEVWRTDGTPKGTRRAFDLRQVAHLQVFQGSLYLTAALGSDPGARGLFRVDHPQGPPVLIAPVSPPYEADFFGKPAFTPMGGRLFFPGNDSGDPGGRELWVTDGTTAGTKRVLDVRPGPDPSDPGGLTAAGDRVFFAADDGVHGRELWVSDGTAEGTRLVWDLSPGEPSSNPQSLLVSGGNLFFAADDGETGVEPWVLRLTPP